MPKIKKRKSRESKLKDLEVQKMIAKKFMYLSAMKTYIIAIVFFIVSLIFNGRYIVLEDKFGESTATSIFDVLIKSFSIILFFFFTIVALGNWMELRGYILTWKEVLIVLIISILQSSTELYVFLIVAFGVVLILTYMYFIQGKIPSDSL
jgi:hypothetical protein